MNRLRNGLQLIREAGLIDRSTVGLTILFCYPFMVTAGLVLCSSATAFTASRLAAAAAFNFAFSLTLVCLLRLLMPTPGGILERLLVGFFTLFIFVSVIHFLLFGQLFGLPSIYAVLDTTPSESSEFAATMLKGNYLLEAFILAFPMLFYIVRPIRLSPLPIKWRRLAAVATAGLLVGLGYGGGLRPYLYMNNGLLLVTYTVPEAIQQKSVLQNLYATIPVPSSVTTNFPRSQPMVHILVIGESTTSRHMSLYGYGRDTNPRLSEIKSTLEVAPDVCSSRGTTMAQLKEMLTFATREDAGPLLSAPSLLQLMKAAGYKVFWLSNQQMVGSWDNWSAVFSKPADVRIFTDRRGGFEGASHDDKLLPLLRNALEDPAKHKFIVVHMIGTHHAYDLRYPAAFARFEGTGPEQDKLLGGATNMQLTRYNQYDNAVLYNDYIVSEIIKLAGAAGGASLTYLSDHGEALGETSGIYGHFDGLMPRQVYEIPLLFLFSALEKSALAHKLDIFRANLTKPFQTDALIHTLLELYGVEHEAWHPERSLFDAQYKPGQRYCDTLEP